MGKALCRARWEKTFFWLEGKGGDDILISGTGNDTLRGGGGNNVFLFNKGNGQDVREPCKIADGLDCRFHNPRFSMVFSSPDNVNLEFF